MVRIPIQMPQLGEAIAEAIVRAIKVQPFDTVQADQDVFEVETNKTVLSVTVPCKGRILEIVAELEQSYPVGATLGYLEVAEKDARNAGISTPPASREPESAPSAPVPSSPKPPQREALTGVHFKVDEEDAFQEREDESPGVRPTISLPVPANTIGATYLSPRMKARMQELGLNGADLSGIAGTGGGGRVTVEDFERFIRELDAHEQSPASPMRVAVADAMRRSCLRPLATVGRSVLLDGMLLHRKSCNPKPGPTLYAVRALGIALAENTAVAGRLVGNKIVHPKTLDIGFAVEVPDGVLVPIIRNIQDKPLLSLVDTYNDLVRQAQERRLSPEARGTGVATVTNFGTFGLIWATPIPLPEQNLVLGLGAGRKVPVWSNEVNTFVPATEAEITLSFDHRICDGGAAGRLLARISDLLQEPERL